MRILSTLSSSGTNQDVWFYCDDVDLTGAVGCQIEFTNGSKNRGFKGVAGVPKFNGKTDTFDDVLGTFTGVELNNNNNRQHLHYSIRRRVSQGVERKNGKGALQDYKQPRLRV